MPLPRAAVTFRTDDSRRLRIECRPNQLAMDLRGRAQKGISIAQQFLLIDLLQVERPCAAQVGRLARSAGTFCGRSPATIFGG